MCLCVFVFSFSPLTRGSLFPELPPDAPGQKSRFFVVFAAKFRPVFSRCIFVLVIIYVCHCDSACEAFLRVFRDEFVSLVFERHVLSFVCHIVRGVSLVRKKRGTTAVARMSGAVFVPFRRASFFVFVCVLALATFLLVFGFLAACCP